MNTSVDPCDDFYEYACGGFEARYKMENRSVDRYRLAERIVDLRVQDLLQENYGLHYPPGMREAVGFKSQCEPFMNMTRDERIEAFMSDFKSNRQNVLGSWPVGSASWNDSEFDLQKALTYLQKSFWFGVFYDLNEDISKVTGRLSHIYITEHPFLVDIAYEKNDMPRAIRERIADPMMQLVHNYTANESVKPAVDQLNTDIFDVTYFVSELAQTLLNHSTNLESNHTLSELKNTSTQIDWAHYLKLAYGENDFDETTKVLFNQQHLMRIDRVLQRTSKRTLANYVIFQFMTQYLSKVESSNSCLQMTRDIFVHAIGAAYVDKYLDERQLVQIGEQLNQVRSAFMELLNTTKWMDDVTRQRAQRKLRLINAHIALPEMYSKKEELRYFYKPMKIAKENDTSAFIRTYDSTFALRKRAQRMRWKIEGIFLFRQREGTLRTNAEYDVFKNSIGIFAGILIEPFYHPDRPVALNYGAIGVIIGHEFTHGFDARGRHFDENGEKVNWWTKSSAEEYNKRYKCFVKSYEQFAPKDQNATAYAILTAPDNIADGGGIQESYEALKTVLRNNPAANKRLPAPMSKYTPEQLFFISFANHWCSHSTQNGEAKNRRAVHSRKINRVRGTLMNFAGFSEAFQCPKSAKMNPTVKCSLFE